jgi:Tol biopolymer transport system component
MRNTYQQGRVIFLSIPVIALMLGACAQVFTPARPVVSMLDSQPLEKIVAVVPDGYNVRDMVFSPFDEVVLYSAGKAGEQNVFFKNEQGKSYDRVKFLTLSHDSRRSAYVARSKGREFIVVDGFEGKKYRAVDSPVFSPDSQYFAYESEIDRKWHVVIGEREGPAADMFLMEPVFSADSMFVTSIETDSRRGTSTRIVSSRDMKDIRKGFAYDSISSVAFSQDRSRVAHGARIGDRQFVVVSDFSSVNNDKRGKTYDKVSSVALSDDGGTVTYYSEKRGRTYLVIGEKEVDFAGDTILFPPVFNGDGSQVAVGVTQEGKNLVLIDGKGGMPYDAVTRPVFSPDGSRLLYRAARDGKWYIILADADGERIREYPFDRGSKNPVFSRDGKSIVYGSKQGQKLLLRIVPVE